MSALKNMEIIFGVMAVAGCAVAALPDSAAKAAAQRAAAHAPMQVVVIKAKRMTALEKRQSRQSAEVGSALHGAGHGT